MNFTKIYKTLQLNISYLFGVNSFFYGYLEKNILMITRLIKTASILIVVLFAVSCSDDIPTVGGGIMPDGDNIHMYSDEINLTAKTVSIGPDLYIRADSAILGSINDPILGRTQSDFMGQFFVANVGFQYGYDGLDGVAIDSVRMIMAYKYSDFWGDFQAPMGVTIYALNESLEPNFYTNVDPNKYCRKDTILGQRFFTQNDLPLTYSDATYTYYRGLEIDFDKSVGQKIFDKWKSDTLSGKKETILYSTERFREFMKGIYVTTTFNDKSMIKFTDINASLYMNIYYSYNMKDVSGADSLVSRFIPFPIGAEALHLNNVNVTPFEDLEISKNTQTDRTYIKGLSGVVTEVTIPLKKIKEKGFTSTGVDDFTLNSALLSFVGMTEKEDDLAFTLRPSNLLFVNSDSIKNYFLDGKQANGSTTLLLTRSSANNVYNFNSGLYATNTTRNFAILINHYLKEHPELDEVKYLLVPVQTTTESVYNNGSYVTNFSGVYNSFSPSAAILRTSEEYMKVPVIFSKFVNK